MLSALILIFIFATIQSVFGIGLLVFGTPSLILLGFSFEEALLTLLPSSLLISLLQLKEDHKLVDKFILKFCSWTIPSMVLGLILALTVLPGLPLKFFIAGVLFFGAAIRLSPSLNAVLQSWLNKNERLYLLVMGLVHGMSNLGGGLLTVYAGLLFSEKRRVRVHVAMGYAVFAIAQIIVLLVLKHSLLKWELLLPPLVAITAFLSIGRWSFNVASAAVFNNAMTAFMLIFAAMLLL